MFDAYDDFDGGGGVGGFHSDGVDEGPIDGDSTHDELDPVVASHKSGAIGW